MKKKNAVFGTAVEALRRVKDNPGKLVLASILDIMFFVAYGFITAPLFTKAVEYIVIMGSIVSENAPQVVRGASPSLSSIISSNPQASLFLQKVILIFIIIAAAVYVLYVFFQGLSWRISSEIAGKKSKLYDYMADFAVVNLFWLAFFIINHLISLYSDIREASLQTFNIETSGAFPVFVLVFLLAIMYFAFISYIVPGKPWHRIKQSFSVGLKKAGYIIPVYLVIASVYFIFKYFTESLAGINMSLMMIAGILTIIPAMTWARVYLTLAVEKVK